MCDGRLAELEYLYRDSRECRAGQGSGGWVGGREGDLVQYIIILQ